MASNVGGVNFDNEVFRNRLLVDKILSGRYKKAMEVLFTRKPVTSSLAGTWMDYGTTATASTNAQKTDFADKSTKYEGSKEKVDFSLIPFAHHRPIIRANIMDERMLLHAQNEVFRILTDAVYENIFKKAMEVITAESTIKTDNFDISENQSPIKKIGEEGDKLAIPANKVIMTPKVARKLLLSKEIVDKVGFYSAGILDYNKLGTMIGIDVVPLIDPKNLFDKKIIIMYKDDDELSTETALRNYVQHGLDGFHYGEYARTYESPEPGAKGGIVCELTVHCDPKIVNKKLIRVLNLKNN